MDHIHTVATVDRMNRTMIETCACGAYRITWESGHVDDWHACALCAPGAAR
jgi:hypothetical protein